MRALIAGGTGFLGGALAASLRDKGHSVSLLTRKARGPGHVEWDPARPAGEWARHVREADVVVNLAGESIAGARWTASRKALLRSSRLGPTGALVREILSAPKPPVLVNGSAVGFYGARGDEPLTEESPPGTDFLATLTRDWEDAANAAARVTRVVLLRSGVVLARDGGALPQLARPFWFFVGGPVASGRQYMSWIHLDDWVRLTEWALSSVTVSGPLNLTAPDPVTNRDLAHALGAAIGRPAFLRVPALPLRLALGELAEAAILNGQRVLPARAVAMGFAFRYPTIEAALGAIYGDAVQS